jgi:phage gpG-like protein
MKEDGSFYVDDTGLELLLSELKAKLKDMTPVMKAIGGIVEASVQENFEVGGRWSGVIGSFLGGSQKWAPLAEQTMKRKQEANKTKTLIWSSALMNSISSEAGPDSVKIGTNVPYAATHQFGAAKGDFGDMVQVWVKAHVRKTKKYGEVEVDEHIRTMSLPWGNIPARPFLVIQEEDFLDISKKILDYLVKAQ